MTQHDIARVGRGWTRRPYNNATTADHYHRSYNRSHNHSHSHYNHYHRSYRSHNHYRPQPLPTNPLLTHYHSYSRSYHHNRSYYCYYYQPLLPTHC